MPESRQAAQSRDKPRWNSSIDMWMKAASKKRVLFLLICNITRARFGNDKKTQKSISTKRQSRGASLEHEPMANAKSDRRKKVTPMSLDESFLEEINRKRAFFVNEKITRDTISFAIDDIIQTSC